MEFSDMMKRCRLSEISNYLMGCGELLTERKDLDFATTVRNAEEQTNKFLEEYFEDTNDRDEFYSEIATREIVLKETYFQMGFIAGINISKEIEKRTAELNQGSPL